MSGITKPETKCTRCPILCGNTGTHTFVAPEGCPYPSDPIVVAKSVEPVKTKK